MSFFWWVSLVIQILLFFYLIRHATFTIARLFKNQNWNLSFWRLVEAPRVAVFVPAHNEELVVADCIQALLKQNYPAEKLTIYPVNDRSKDRTGEILDRLALENPGRLVVTHRKDGKPGKSAALKELTEKIEPDVFVIFDADYVPGPELVAQLVRPFQDISVGSVMGRVIPMNADSNLLTRMLYLERVAGYQVDQQAREALGGITQFGGTVGAVRRIALADVGGWNDHALAEDTDLTYRLFIRGWRVVYHNACECFEEVPENWPVRIRQIARWAKGHNQVMIDQWLNVLRAKHLRVWQKVDALMLLGIYLMAPLLTLGWVSSFLVYLLAPDYQPSWMGLSWSLLTFSSLGNFALFFETISGLILDKNIKAMRLMPLGFLFFIVSLWTVTKALIDQLRDGKKAPLHWDKTLRYRKSSTAEKSGAT